MSHPTDNQAWTAPQLVQWIAQDFARRGLPPNHRQEAERLVCKALSLTRLQLYLQFDKPLSHAEREAVKPLLRRRWTREPLAYILGETEFWNLSIKVGPGVLIPRVDSETLILQLLPLFHHQPGPHLAAELGAGSLALSLALASETKNLRLYSTEASPQAMAYAEANLAAHQDLLQTQGCEIHLLAQNHLQGLPPGLDLLFSNPPYIPRSLLPELQPEVRDFEPPQALDGGPSGLDFYPLLATAGLELLKPGGYLAFEHGFDQRGAIQDLLTGFGRFKLIRADSDTGGNPRAQLWQLTH